MKHDQEKPVVEDFFWDGLKIANPFLRGLIDATCDFHTDPIDSNLALLMMHYKYDLVKAEIGSNQVVYDLIKVHNYGAKLYGTKDYLQADLKKIIAALNRHLIAMALGVAYDESTFSHWAHFGANLLMAAELLKTSENNKVTGVSV